MFFYEALDSFGYPPATRVWPFYFIQGVELRNSLLEDGRHCDWNCVLEYTTCTPQREREGERERERERREMPSNLCQ